MREYKWPGVQLVDTVNLETCLSSYNASLMSAKSVHGVLVAMHLEKAFSLRKRRSAHDGNAFSSCDTCGLLLVQRFLRRTG